MTRSLTAAALLLLSGCLTSSTPHSRYFSPAVAPPEAGEPSGFALRFRGLQAGSHLKERVVWRLNQVEMGYYDLRRWLVPPPVAVQSALEQYLFEGRGIQRSLSGAVPTLETQLLAYEEELAPQHLARIELRALLVDRDSRALLDKTYRVTRPIPGEEPEDMARAMGQALQGLAEELSADVLRSLGGT